MTPSSTMQGRTASAADRGLALLALRPLTAGNMPMGRMTLGYLRLRLNLADARVVPDAQDSRCRQI
jgi:hypothetical protein